MNTNDHDHDADLVGAYVLDTLPPEESAAFEEHLRGCATCRAEVAELRQVVDVLPLAVETVEPPAGLRDRIVAAASAESAGRPELRAVEGGRIAPVPRWRFSPRSGLLAVAAAVLILALGAWNVRLQQQIRDQQSTIAFQRAVETALAHHAAVMPVSGTSVAREATAVMVQPPRGGHAYLIVQGLPRSPQNKVYQLWLVRNTPRSAGIFTYQGPDPKIVNLPMAASGYAVAAVTVEPGPHGSRGPTGPKLLLGKLT